MRLHYQKYDEQYITIEEFCRYTGIPKAEVLPFIKD